MNPAGGGDGLDGRLAALRRDWNQTWYGDLPDRLWRRFAALLDERGIDPDAITAAAGEEPPRPGAEQGYGSAAFEAARQARFAWRDALSAARAPVRDAFGAAMRELFEEPLWGGIPHGPPSFPENDHQNQAAFPWVEIGGVRIAVGDEYRERRRKLKRAIRVTAIQAEGWGTVRIAAMALGPHVRGRQEYTRLSPESLLGGFVKADAPAGVDDADGRAADGPRSPSP